MGRVAATTSRAGSMDQMVGWYVAAARSSNEVIMVNDSLNSHLSVSPRKEAIANNSSTWTNLPVWRTDWPASSSSTPCQRLSKEVSWSGERSASTKERNLMMHSGTAMLLDVIHVYPAKPQEEHSFLKASFGTHNTRVLCGGNASPRRGFFRSYIPRRTCLFGEGGAQRVNVSTGFTTNTFLSGTLAVVHRSHRVIAHDIRTKVTPPKLQSPIPIAHK